MPHGSVRPQRVFLISEYNSIYLKIALLFTALKKRQPLNFLIAKEKNTSFFMVCLYIGFIIVLLKWIMLCFH